MHNRMMHGFNLIAVSIKKGKTLKRGGPEGELVAEEVSNVFSVCLIEHLIMCPALCLPVCITVWSFLS